MKKFMSLLIIIIVFSLTACGNGRQNDFADVNFDFSNISSTIHSNSSSTPVPSQVTSSANTNNAESAPSFSSSNTANTSSEATSSTETVEKRVSITKTANSITVTQGKNEYTLRRHISKGINLDTWRLTRQVICGEEVWKDIDIEGPLKQEGAADFIGGYHGDEVFETVSMTADGVELDVSSNWSAFTTANFTVLVKSKVYYCNDTEKVAFIRHKKLVFTDNKLTVTNDWEYVGDENFVLSVHTGGGIWSIFCDQIKGYSTNTDSTIKNNVGTAGGKAMDEVTIYGIKDFTVTIKGLSQKDKHYAADVSYFGYEKRPRIKPYFMTVYTSTPRVLATGTRLSTAFSITVE
ncbi:MAG: hypothetical protein E7525_05375 [Ruminococcaceae bacterium]|nr:hypothetical protein [Oscillospiraceae bacterium]